MENINKHFSNTIEQAVLFSDNQEFSFYFSLDNLLSVHFSRTGNTLLYEVPYNDANSIFPSHIRPSLLLSYSVNFQNSLNEPLISSSQKPSYNQNKSKGHINSTTNTLKQPSIINKQKTSYILNKYKNSVKDVLKLRNMYSSYPFFPLEWIINEKDGWFRTNSKLVFVHWPYIPAQANNNDDTYLSYSLYDKLNISVLSNNITTIQSMDKYVTITISPHYQIFKVRYPIYLGKFSENLFQYTHSENIYNDLYHGQYVYYYITQEFSIKDIPNWCHYPLWLIQHYTNVNLSISNPVKDIDKKDMIVERIPSFSLEFASDTNIQSPPDYENPRPIKLLYTPEATYRLLPTNEIEIKVNDDETIFRTNGLDMTYMSMYLPERHGQEDLIKWKGMGRTFSSVITNHISNKRYPLQKFLHQALIIYQSNGLSSIPHSKISSDTSNIRVNKYNNFHLSNHSNEDDYSISNNLPVHLYNYGLDEQNLIPISPMLSSEVHEHLAINENDFWAYIDGRVRVVFSDRVIISMKINSDKCEVIQKNGEKIVLRLSKVLGYKQYIKVTLDFAKWAFSTKAHRESERLKKIQIKNIIRNEVRRNELFLFMTDYTRLQRHINNDKIISNLDDITGRKRLIEEGQFQDINYVKLSELLTTIQEKNMNFLSNSK